MITKELLKECRLEFDEYFQSLVTNSPDNQHKVEEIRAHSIRVSANALLLANIVLQTEGEKRIAELTGLFHDFGKASLIIQGTDSPTNIQRDHASLSAKLIEQMRFYSKLPAEIQLIVLRSVENHSKLKLPKLDNEQQTLFAGLLRDADKLDIYDSSYRFFKEKYGIQPIVTFDLIKNADISEKIMKSIQSGKTAVYGDMRTMNDYKLLLISMAFDLNFKVAFRILSEKQYLQKIYETLPRRDPIIDAYRGIKLFTENKFIS
ncbi:MAG TPA: HD domain-containing protein [Prolixibacteraceae bacterium]|nr:HD domain-containing protein [Prolixibacteraceae bacterium]